VEVLLEHLHQALEIVCALKYHMFSMREGSRAPPVAPKTPHAKYFPPRALSSYSGHQIIGAGSSALYKEDAIVMLNYH
jgi:hypothetical protein